ncbi:MAG: hypothetical protein ACKV1O_29190 [Saprospiraceae bacterium]
MKEMRWQETVSNRQKKGILPAGCNTAGNSKIELLLAGTSKPKEEAYHLVL